ncbi:MAG TPA: peptidoglycan DD-metalloendopeptidase family protein [Anaerolineales bacterium]
MKRTNLVLFRALIALAILLPGSFAAAQQAQPDGPYYIVQAGDSLWDIALRFGVSLDDLKNANGISNANQLSSGSKLVIPGLEGIQGVLETQPVPFGETLHSLSRRYQVPTDSLIRLNHLTSPAELYAGRNLIVPQQDKAPAADRRAGLVQGQSLLELAVAQSANPWALVAANALSGTWSALPGDVLRIPNQPLPQGQPEGPGALPGPVITATVKPLPLVQGKAAVLQLNGPAGLKLTGSLAGRELHFFPEDGGSYVALQGVHAMTDPGFYSLALTGTLPSGVPFTFSQQVYIRSGDYRIDPPLTVSSETIDPAVTKPEDAQWFALASTFSTERLWDGIFKSPAPPEFSDCFPSIFGSRRSFNGSAYIYFHSGLDFCGGVGTEIHAPAAGTVIFAGPLTVRGNATMIDHGWGVFTGYMHQSKLLVQVGDHVQAGQLIGLVGGTGRVTGPHLHWEVLVGGIQVDPADWLKQLYP